MTEIVRRRVLMLQRMPCREEALVGLELFAAVLGARSALRFARNRGLCKREGLTWQRTEKGDEYIRENAR